MDILNNFELAFLELIQNNFHNPILNDIFLFISKSGNLGLIWIVIILALFLSKENKKTGILVVLALLIAVILGEGLLKNLFQRPRPFVEFSHLKSLLPNYSGYSFPSGHTASSFAAAFVLMNAFKKYKYVFLSIALIMGFSRVFLLVHYPSDILGGLLLGLFSAFLAKKILEKRKSI